MGDMSSKFLTNPFLKLTGQDSRLVFIHHLHKKLLAFVYKFKGIFIKSRRLYQIIEVGMCKEPLSF